MTLGGTVSTRKHLRQTWPGLSHCPHVANGNSTVYTLSSNFGQLHDLVHSLFQSALSCFDCLVLDLGAGSGLLAMLAARALARLGPQGGGTIVAVEASLGRMRSRTGCAKMPMMPVVLELRNPDLAALATKTIERNRGLYPNASINVIPRLSTHVKPKDLGRQADLLVTETFGTLLLGEGALGFVSDASCREVDEHALRCARLSQKW